MGLEKSFWRAGALAILLTVLAACGDDPIQSGATRWTPTTPSDPAGARWKGEIANNKETGEIAAVGFNELIATAAPTWAQAPDTATAELLHLDRGFDGPVEIYLLAETEGNEPVITVTLTRLGDDSIQAIRYRVVLKRGEDGRYRFVSGRKTSRCQSGRGHQTFEVSFCQ